MNTVAKDLSLLPVAALDGRLAGLVLVVAIIIVATMPSGATG